MRRRGDQLDQTLTEADRVCHIVNSEMLTKPSFSLTEKRPRPTLLGHPKYRHKEEKRKLMKMTCKKLKKLEDPESVLCKAVLINNTLKYLRDPQISFGHPVTHDQETSQSQNSPDQSHQHQQDASLDILNSEIVFPPPLSDNINSENDFLDICDRLRGPGSGLCPRLTSGCVGDHGSNSDSSTMVNNMEEEEESLERLLSDASSVSPEPLTEQDLPPAPAESLSGSGSGLCSGSKCDNSELSLYSLPLHRIACIV